MLEASYEPSLPKSWCCCNVYKGTVNRKYPKFRPKFTSTLLVVLASVLKINLFPFMGYITHTRCQLHNILYVVLQPVHTYVCIAPHGEWKRKRPVRSCKTQSYEWMIQTETLLLLILYNSMKLLRELSRSCKSTFWW